MSSLRAVAGTVRDSGSMIGRGVLRDLRRAKVRHAGAQVPRTDFDPTHPDAIADPWAQLGGCARSRWR